MINEEAKMIENGDITHAIDSLHEALLFARLGTYANKDEVWKRPLTAMKQDVWEQLVKVE